MPLRLASVLFLVCDKVIIDKNPRITTVVNKVISLVCFDWLIWLIDLLSDLLISALTIDLPANGCRSSS